MHSNHGGITRKKVNKLSHFNRTLYICECESVYMYDVTIYNVELLSSGVTVIGTIIAKQ